MRLPSVPPMSTRAPRFALAGAPPPCSDTSCRRRSVIEGDATPAAAAPYEACGSASAGTDPLAGEDLACRTLVCRRDRSVAVRHVDRHDIVVVAEVGVAATVGCLAIADETADG